MDAAWAAAAEAALVLPPTSALPRLRREPDAEVLRAALDQLETVYGVAPPGVPDGLTDRLDAVRADPTERTYVLDWLTRLVDSGAAWVDVEESRALVEHAARLLEGCTSALEAGELVRDFAFPMADEVPDVCAGPSRAYVNLTVRDAPLPPSDAHSVQGFAEAAAAVGVQTYASSVIMCDLFVRRPEAWHAALAPDAPAYPHAFTVYELGAGTGIVGMVAAKVLCDCPPRAPSIDVFITDYHADVMDNLRYNVDTFLGLQDGRLPSAAQHAGAVGVTCEALDWRVLHDLVYPAAASGSGVATRVPPPQSAPLLLAADVVYDPMHATWLLASIVYLLRQPDTDPDARAHILVPVRSAGRLAGLYATVDEAIAAQAPRRGYVLATVAQRRLPRRRGIGRQDEGEYIWTELAWRRA